MLSKVIRPTSRTLYEPLVKHSPFLTPMQKREFSGSNPGILARVFNVIDKNTTAFSVAKFDPSKPLQVSFLFLLL